MLNFYPRSTVTGIDRIIEQYGIPQWHAWGGALNGLTLLAFVLGTVSAAIRGTFTPVPKALRDV
jgi:hypothetical protein